jgi:peptide/nickel transport system substrate-binding protein
MLSTYDPLVHRRLAPDIQPLNTDTICRLCESWSVSADNRTYTFRLRNNVKWHDGRPMTADDVVFSFQRAGNRDNRFGIVTSRLIDMESVSKVDEQTVRIVTTGPAPDFLIDIESVMIVPKHVLEADPNGLRTRAVGTGPYRLTSYDSNVAARFEKNRDYYVAGRPWMDGMEIVFLADRSAQQAGFLAGQLDFYTVNDKAEFEPLQRARPDIGVQSYQAILANGIGPNQRRDPWNRLEVRRALHLSIDRQRLNEQLAFGGGLPVNPPSTSVFRPYALPQEELLRMPGFNPQTKQQDIASARQLLAQAGFPNGIRSTMFTWRTFSSTPRQVEAIGPMAAAAGIELELQLLEAGVAQTNWTRGDFDLAVRPMNGQSWPGSAYGFYLTGANDNYYGINDPTLDGLIRQQATEFNRERRYELLRQVQRRILDQMHVIPIIELNPYAMWQARVNNFRHYSLGAQPYPLNGVAEVIWLAR